MNYIFNHKYNIKCVDSSDKLKVLNSSLKESDSVQKSNRFDAMIKSLVHSSTISRELEKDEETEGYDEDFEDAKAIQKVEDDSGFYQEDFDEEYQDEEFEVVGNKIIFEEYDK